MADRNKYNLKQELVKLNDHISGAEDGVDRRLTLLGVDALTKPDYNNSMRTNMFTSQSRQYLTLTKPQFPKVYFGAENTTGDESDGYYQVKDGDKEVFRKIVKYEKLIGKSKYLRKPTIYELFLYDKKTDTYSVVHRTPCEDLTELFGFDYNNDEIDKYEEGDTINNGTVLYRSTSYDPDTNFGYGMNVPTMYTLDPGTIEDAAVFSDVFAEQFMSSEIETIEIGLNDNDFLLNMQSINKLFGKNSNNYKTLPKLGEQVDGILAVSRRLFNDQQLYDFRNDNLSRIIEGDNVYYYSGRILDYTIYSNNPEMEDNSFNHDMLKYIREQRKYWEEINATCEEIVHSGSKYTRDINYLLGRSRWMLDDENSKWKEGDSEFSNVVIKIMVARHVGCQPGQKCTPRYGNKSVASKIVPEREMPYYYDENGNKVHAKVLLNLLAIINRTTAYPLYEMGLTLIEDKLARYMRQLESRKSQESIFFEVLDLFDPDYAKETLQIYKSLSKEEKDAYMDHVIYGDENYDNGIFLRDMPFLEKEPIFYRLMKIFDKYKDSWLKFDRTYNEMFGREIPSLNRCIISEMYFMKLKQTSRKGYSARSEGALNSKSLPEKSYKSRAHLEKASSKPIRFGKRICRSKTNLTAGNSLELIMRLDNQQPRLYKVRFNDYRTA